MQTRKEKRAGAIRRLERYIAVKAKTLRDEEDHKQQAKRVEHLAYLKSIHEVRS
jgi:hypothetical protein